MFLWILLPRCMCNPSLPAPGLPSIILLLLQSFFWVSWCISGVRVMISVVFGFLGLKLELRALSRWLGFNNDERIWRRRQGEKERMLKMHPSPSVHRWGRNEIVGNLRELIEILKVGLKCKFWNWVERVRVHYPGWVNGLLGQTRSSFNWAGSWHHELDSSFLLLDSWFPTWFQLQFDS